MSSLRLQESVGNPEVLDVRETFSNFDFIESRFGKGGSLAPLKRIFSQMRHSKFSTIVIENIPSTYFSQEDDEELVARGVPLSGKPLCRISFFKNFFSKSEEIDQQDNESYLGYVILKLLPNNKLQLHILKWITFESITKSSRYINNFYHGKKMYQVRCGNKIFEIEGNLYCQQNNLTNVCAHVALRSALAMLPQYDDFSYKQINEILQTVGQPHAALGAPLSIEQIRKILDHLDVKYTYQWYPGTTTTQNTGNQTPNVYYQKYLYSSIESGYPALLAFMFGGVSGHMIPILGHTFNEDTWVPNAETSYYSIGKSTKYIPSEMWVSSYICHDDNFGSHFCLPRQYMPKENELFVFATRPREAVYDAVAAEAKAADDLYLIASEMIENIPWSKRLKEEIIIKKEGRFVLRTIFMSGAQYIEALARSVGKNPTEKIDQKRIEVLGRTLTEFYWIVEVSLPELFPANKRKLGEVVLRANKPISDPETFIYARLPGLFYFLGNDQSGKLIITTRPSEITSHSEIFS